MLTLRPLVGRRSLAGGLVLGLAATGLVVGPALAGDPAPQDPVSAAAVQPDAVQPAPIGAIQPDQKQHLKLLRRARRASDDLPADALVAASPARFGRNPSLSRAIDTPTGKGWVVPGDDVLCLIAPDPIEGYGTTCASTELVERQGLTLGIANAERSTAVTLVPDGAAVTATDTGDHTRALQPDDSGVVAVDAEKTDSIGVTTDKGHTESPTPDAAEIGDGTAP